MAVQGYNKESITVSYNVYEKQFMATTPEFQYLSTFADSEEEAVELLIENIEDKIQSLIDC